MREIIQSGAAQPVPMIDGELITPAKLLSATDAAFENRRGDAGRRGQLTAAIQSLPSQERDFSACDAKLVVAAFTSSTMQRQDLETERHIAEKGILAHWHGGFHNNNHEMVSENDLMPTLKDIEETGKMTVEVLLRNDLIREGDTVIDVGTGKGFIPKYLALQAGIDVEAIEPGTFLPRERPAFDATKQLTAKEYTEKYPGQQFSVVSAMNICPAFVSAGRVADIFDMGMVREFIGDLSKMTSDGGTTLIGISSMDPRYLSLRSEFQLWPYLKENYQEVECLWPEDLGEEFSIGGQMALLKCTGPKRDKAAPRH